LQQAWQIVQAADDPDATIILDAFHTWNTNSSQDLMREIPAHRISHYHIDDADPRIPAGRQRDPDRTMIGEGPIDLRREIQILRAIGYEGTISLELFNPTLWEQDPAEVLKRGYERLQALLDES
jgi:2-keto-myo-inositol isomerase